MSDDQEQTLDERVADLGRRMKLADWWYSYSDDSSVRTRGAKVVHAIYADISALGENNEAAARALWAQYAPKEFMKPVFPSDVVRRREHEAAKRVEEERAIDRAVAVGILSRDANAPNYLGHWHYINSGFDFRGGAFLDGSRFIRYGKAPEYSVVDDGKSEMYVPDEGLPRAADYVLAGAKVPEALQKDIHDLSMRVKRLRSGRRWSFDPLRRSLSENDTQVLYADLRAFARRDPEGAIEIWRTSAPSTLRDTPPPFKCEQWPDFIPATKVPTATDKGCQVTPAKVATQLGRKRPSFKPF